MKSKRNKRFRLRKTLRKNKQKQKGGWYFFNRNKSKKEHKEDTQSSKKEPYTLNPFTRAYRYFMNTTRRPDPHVAKKDINRYREYFAEQKENPKYESTNLSYPPVTQRQTANSSDDIEELFQRKKAEEKRKQAVVLENLTEEEILSFNKDQKIELFKTLYQELELKNKSFINGNAIFYNFYFLDLESLDDLELNYCLLDLFTVYRVTIKGEKMHDLNSTSSIKDPMFFLIYWEDKDKYVISKTFTGQPSPNVYEKTQKIEENDLKEHDLSSLIPLNAETKKKINQLFFFKGQAKMLHKVQTDSERKKSVS